jgi:hypothetical protein
MEEQRSQRGCIAGRMPLEFHHGLLACRADVQMFGQRPHNDTFIDELSHKIEPT